jgi:hypothetical protein
VADLVAIISVLSSAAVALGSAGITAVTTNKREKYRFASETRRDRENELRGVADDAATQLSNAIWRLQYGRDNLGKLGPVHEAYGAISNCEDRLAIRLGNDVPEVACYRAAVEQVRTGLQLLVTSEEEKGRHALIDPDNQTLDNIRGKALEHQRAFRDMTAKRLSPDAAYDFS